MINILVVVLLVLLVVGAFPRWPHSSEWGPYPSSFFGLVLIIFLVLYLTGRFRF